MSNCPGCGDLPDELLVETGKGDSFPAPIGRLEKMVEGVGSGGRLLTCSHCSAFFVWQDIPQVYGSGWLDEEKLTRLPPNESELLARFFAGTLEDVEDLLAGLGVPLARFVLTSCALSSADPGRVRRLVPALVRRHLQGDTTLDAVLSQYMDVSIAATEDVLAACKALPVHPTTDELVLRCKKKLKSLKAALARNR